jgi:prepilin-type processing-associated H-X9-DG protein
MVLVGGKASSSKVNGELNMVRQYEPKTCTRRGITRVEVVVILGICVLLTLMCAPAVLSARGAARKLECLNNMRNVGLGIQNLASRQSGKLPFLSAVKIIKNSSDVEGDFVEGWPITLLPVMGSTNLYEKIIKNAVIESGQARLRDEERVVIPGLGCPDNREAFKKPGRLSFVLNAGFLSQSLYHGDPDRKHVPGSLAWIGEPGDEEAVAVHAATGAFWQATDAFEPSLEYIFVGDGATATLMVTENLQAGNWYDTDTASISFGFPVANSDGKVPLGSGHSFESAENPLNTEFAGGTLTTATPLNWRLNADRQAKVKTLPRPSSNHSGGVNVIFCDGAGKVLNQEIDPYVYLKLITSNGVAHGEDALTPGQ